MVQDKIRRKKMFSKDQISYDEMNNVLYVSTTDPPRSGIAEQVGHDVFVRIDPKTNELVGVTILNFMKDVDQTMGSEGIVKIPTKNACIKRIGHIEED